MREILLSGSAKQYGSLREYVDELHASGRYCFAKEDAASTLACSPDALRMSLVRLGRKGRIVSVSRGFYVIVPQEYRAIGILPPQLFVADLMGHVGAEYYVGLLSAAAMHGAGHQQPQEFQVVVPEPRRTIRAKGLRLRFFVKKDITNGTRVEVKTDTGYVAVSSPALTALDLVAYQKRVGGVNRVATVLSELSENMTGVDLVDEAEEYPTRAVVQRLGYLLSETMGLEKLVAELRSWMKKQASVSPVPLVPGMSVQGAPRDPDWQVLVNAEVESDL